MKIVECPRDAMQGIESFIPTARKIEYLNKLLKVGFDVLDCGSFVSPKAVPQMKDTAEVITEIDWENSDTQLLTIIANERGVDAALKHDQISYLGYPLSISETFQLRNTKSSIADGFRFLEKMSSRLFGTNKTLTVYLSMGFGNPYGDAYSHQLIYDFIERLIDLNIRSISIADTVGNASVHDIEMMSSLLSDKEFGAEIGFHLHASPSKMENVAQTIAQCRINRVDTALKGFGGCPFAADELTGNLATETLIKYLPNHSLDMTKLSEALLIAGQVFQP